MSYPLSTSVTAGQPTAAEHYNNLRRDALRLGQADADAVALGAFLGRYAANLNIQYLAANRLRVPYSAVNVPTLMINGCMLQASSNVDLPAGQFSGSAATYYVFAVRTPGCATFTLTVNTTSTEATDQRLIGTAYWDGSNVTNIQPYYPTQAGLSAPDYDSGWFAVTYNTTYTKAHSLGSIPRLVMLFHNSASDGSGEWVQVQVGKATGPTGVIGADSTSLYLQSGSDTAAGTCLSTRRTSASGYYRAYAWR